MKKNYFTILILLVSIISFAQDIEKKSTPKIYELTGSITLNDVVKANNAFIGDIPPTYFTDINNLYELLRKKGTLRLKNATLVISALPKNKVTLSFHRIELINSNIFINSNDINLICNEYKQTTSHIYSFNEEESHAQDGKNGVSLGENGGNGKDGLHSGNMFVFVTDKIFSPPGNIDYNLWGQSGGKGGNGNIGVTGADGARGRNCSDGGYQCNRGNSAGHPGENGGKGGNAGDGGDGGDGGKLTFRLHGYSEPYNQFFTFSSIGGNGNNSGVVGRGGNGGKGGRYGSTDCGAICQPYSRRNGADGKIGSSGLEGKNGENGNGQSLSRGTFNVQFLKSFLASWNDPAVKMDLTQEDLIITQSSDIKKGDSQISSLDQN